MCCSFLIFFILNVNSQILQANFFMSNVNIKSFFTKVTRPEMVPRRGGNWTDASSIPGPSMRWNFIFHKICLSEA